MQRVGVFGEEPAVADELVEAVAEALQVVGLGLRPDRNSTTASVLAAVSPGRPSSR
jgi:hypothetical protein